MLYCKCPLMNIITQRHKQSVQRFFQSGRIFPLTKLTQFSAVGLSNFMSESFPVDFLTVYSEICFSHLTFNVEREM